LYKKQFTFFIICDIILLEKRKQKWERKI
jgi:hypothetical protein